MSLHYSRASSVAGLDPSSVARGGVHSRGETRMQRLRVVIVGAGLAGATAAATLREEGFDGQVVLIGAEPMPPYERPPLSKEYLRGESDHHFVRPPEWYAGNAIDARFGSAAKRVNVTDRVVELQGGERVPFDEVVVATGSRNR